MRLRGPQKGSLIDRLVELAHGDVDLVQRAIRESAGQMRSSADLEKVVAYIQNYNASRSNRRERTAA